MMTTIQPARPAAIILLLRDAPDPSVDGAMEVLCLQRSARLGAFSGVLSFPGGKVSEGDGAAAVRDRCDGADALDPEVLPYAVAAIREAFEECGVLIARHAGGDELVGDAWSASHDAERRRLADGSLKTADFLEAHDLRLALDRLTLFAHWITPEFEGRRFDTRFFAARAPATGHEPSHDGGEIVEGLWIAPADALGEAEAGRRTIVFPTRLTLMWLAQHGSVDAALAAAAKRDIRPVMPQIRERDDGRWLTIPPEAGYPVSELPIEVAAGRAPIGG